MGGYDGGYWGGSGRPDAALTNFTCHATDPVGNPEYPNYKGAGNAADGSLMAYSVFVVLGPHTGGYPNGTVGRQVAQMENVTQASLTATLGTVTTSGPAGVGNAAARTITYSPAGFNPTYATWELNASNNSVNATLTVAATAPLDHPVFVLNGYTTNRWPASLAVGPGLTNAGVDYFAGVDPNGQRLWITVNRLVTNALNLVVQSDTSFVVLTAATNCPIYQDTMLNGFEDDWSWAVINDANPAPVYAGSASISVTAAQYQALWTYHDPFNTAPFASLSFWINGGDTGAPGIQVMGVVTNTQQVVYNLPPLAPDTWTPFNLPLAALGVANITNCDGFWFYADNPGTTTFYVDSIQLDAASPPTLSLLPASAASASLVLKLSALTGQTYWLETSTDLPNWTVCSTNVLALATLNFTNQVDPGCARQFWRVVGPP